jgi:hypothetical protein
MVDLTIPQQFWDEMINHGLIDKNYFN